MNTAGQSAGGLGSRPCSTLTWVSEAASEPADGALQPDGGGIGLACSITPTIKKIKRDARETNRHYSDVKVLIFSTASKVTQHEKQKWAKEVLDEFGLQLIVVSRAELINWLLDPARSDICRDQLGIQPSMPPELEPALKRAQDAAKETADNWDRAYRKPGRPVINLKAVKLDEHGNPSEAAMTDALGAALDEGQRIVLEAPAGSGKTTTLVQFAHRVLSAGGLPFLVDLPEWASSHRNILAFIAEYPAFGARDLDASLLSKLRGKDPPTFLLNGWNEVSLANAGAADAALRDLERSFPAATIVVTTRLHRLMPPLRDVVRVQLNQLDRSQRNEYLDLALKESAHDLKVKLDRLVELANANLSQSKRMLLAKVFGQFTDEDDRAQGLCILRDDDLGIPYELMRSMENAFLERRPYGPSGNTYTLSPLGCNAVRKRLFEMVTTDPHRKQSAFALVGQIEVWRLEHGHPADEPRHPVIESEVSWPPFPS